MSPLVRRKLISASPDRIGELTHISEVELTLSSVVLREYIRAGTLTPEVIREVLRPYFPLEGRTLWNREIARSLNIPIQVVADIVGGYFEIGGQAFVQPQHREEFIEDLLDWLS